MADGARRNFSARKQLNTPLGRKSLSAGQNGHSSHEEASERGALLSAHHNRLVNPSW